MDFALPLEKALLYGTVAGSFLPALNFAACAAAVLRREGKKGARGEAGMSRLFDELGLPHLDNFHLRASNGSLTQIDHAVLVPAGIVVVETKDWRGSFTAPFDPRADSWVDEAIDDFAFDGTNPFSQNAWHVEAVVEAVGRDADVFNVVCITHPDGRVRRSEAEEPDELSFLDKLGGDDHHDPQPWGWPGLFHANDMRSRFEKLRSLPADEAARDAWNELQASAAVGRAAEDAHARQVGAEDTMASRVSAAGTLSLVAAGCAALAAAFWGWQFGLLQPLIDRLTG